MNGRGCLLAIAVIGSYWLAGCGTSFLNASGPPVTVKLTSDGAPVPGALVTFYSVVDDEPVASGTTDDFGEFELKLFSKKGGTLVGEHKVTVAWSPETHLERMHAKRTGGIAPTSGTATPELTSELNDLAKTPIKVTVEESQAVLIELPAAKPKS